MLVINTQKLETTYMPHRFSVVALTNQLPQLGNLKQHPSSPAHLRFPGSASQRSLHNWAGFPAQELKATTETSGRPGLTPRSRSLLGTSGLWQNSLPRSFMSEGPFPCWLLAGVGPSPGEALSALPSAPSLQQWALSPAGRTQPF